MKKKLIALLTVATMLAVSPMVALAAENVDEAKPEAAYTEAEEEAVVNEVATEETASEYVIDGTEPDTFLASKDSKDEGSKLGENVYWKYDDSKKKAVTIYGEGEMFDYMTKPPFGNTVEKVVIKEGVTSVSSRLFSGMTSLKAISIPESVVSVGHSAFWGCTGLMDGGFEIPGVLDCVGEDAFCFPGKKAYQVKYDKKTGEEVFPFTGRIQKIRVSGGAEIGAGSFHGCRVNYLIFEGIPESTETGISPNATPNVFIDEILFPGTEEQWKGTVYSKTPPFNIANVHYGVSLAKVVFKSKGEVVETRELIAGESFNNLPVPEREKKETAFGGWYLDEQFANPVIEGTTTVEGACTLYARWKNADIFHVSFYKPEQTDSETVGENWTLLQDQEVYEGLAVTAPDEKLEPGYHSGGWYLDKEYEKPYALSTPVNSNVSLYLKVKGLKSWNADAEVKDKKYNKEDEGPTHSLEVSLSYTPETVYDGRKHVVYSVGTKTTKATASVNPDIAVKGFSVTYDGIDLTKAISIKSFSYENNLEPSLDGKTEKEMIIHPVLSYNGNDPDLKKALSETKDLKAVLGKMMKPSYYKRGWDPESKSWDDEGWEYDRIAVTIGRITLDEDTPVYTKADLSKNPSLKNENGILIWNGPSKDGSVQTVSTKSFGSGDDKVTYVTKAVIPGLYYQQVYSLIDNKGNQTKKTKNISLRAGGWTGKMFDGDAVFTIAGSSFDYFCGEGNSYTKGDYLDLILNDGKKEDWTYDIDEDRMGVRASYGRFTGTLPKFK